METSKLVRLGNDFFNVNHLVRFSVREENIGVEVTFHFVGGEFFVYSMDKKSIENVIKNIEDKLGYIEKE